MNNRLFFKIKDGYKLEIQTPETIKLFGSRKKKKRKNGENVSSLEIVEVVSVRCNLLDNHYPQVWSIIHFYS